MSKLWKPTPIKMIYPVMQKSESVKSECSSDEHFSFIETLRAQAQNPMVKYFQETEFPTDNTKDLEDFLDSLD